MAVAREGRDRRFREQAQAAATERGESTLSEHELERRARQLLKQHMTKLSFLASKKAEEARAS